MKRLAIVGAGGHGRVVADAAQLYGWGRIDFFDDAWAEMNAYGPWPVVGSTSTLCQRLSDYGGVVIAIGASADRLQKQAMMRDAGATIVSIIHPMAAVSQYAQIGTGSVVFAGSVLNAGAVIGEGVILNTGCSVDHDCIIDDYAHISPGAHLGGNVHVGAQSWIGIGASVKHGIKIGRSAIVGVGAAVVADVPDGTCVVGVPARPISDKSWR